jgi:lysophospholipase L1-like esterase
MKNSRRNFLKTAAVGGLTVIGLPRLMAVVSEKKPKAEEGEKKSLTILFQGDSITDGNRTRDNDWNHIMGHGYAYLIASRLWYDHPDRNLMFINRGISGNRVRDLKNRWQTDALDLKPDAISILIGVNDVIATVKDWDPEPIEKFEEHYRAILDLTKTSLPDTTIILCEPFTLPGGWLKEKPKIWAEEIPKRQELVKQLAKEYHAIFIDLQKLFNEALEKAPASYWIWDGIHPMPAGHELIARQWISKVAGKFNL